MTLRIHQYLAMIFLETVVKLKLVFNIAIEESRYLTFYKLDGLKVSSWSETFFASDFESSSSWLLMKH